MVRVAAVTVVAKTFNNRFGFEQGFWCRQTGCSCLLYKRAISVENATH